MKGRDFKVSIGGKPVAVTEIPTSGIPVGEGPFAYPGIRADGGTFTLEPVLHGIEGTIFVTPPKPADWIDTSDLKLDAKGDLILEPTDVIATGLFVMEPPGVKGGVMTLPAKAASGAVIYVPRGTVVKITAGGWRKSIGVPGADDGQREAYIFSPEQDEESAAEWFCDELREI